MHNRKLGRTADHRKALLRNMATDMIVYEKIETTEKKALELRSVVDELVTLAKKGDLHARRQVLSYVRDVKVGKTDKTAVQKLFDEIGPRYADRKGGYTRVVKTGVRKGDAAPMAYIEFIK
ncbi:MAG: 50S ribosomal protein L17 [Erysipelotrichaceae bacterium]|nr:50S ribosomal protein L17 [Erysipelotrichaceae bacterium]